MYPVALQRAASNNQKSVLKIAEREKEQRFFLRTNGIFFPFCVPPPACCEVSVANGGVGDFRISVFIKRDGVMPFLMIVFLNTLNILVIMGLLELTVDDFFRIDGPEFEGYISPQDSNTLILSRPVRGVFPGPRIRRFYLGDDQSLLYLEFKSPVTGDLQSFEIGTVNDLNSAKTWIERVNKLYEK